MPPIRIGVLALLLLSLHPAIAEDGSAAWLRYAPVLTTKYKKLPSRIVVLGASNVERTAGEELARGLSAMLGRQFQLSIDTPMVRTPHIDTIVLGSYTALSNQEALANPAPQNGVDRYTIQVKNRQAASYVSIAGSSPQAELYGVFHLLEEVGAMRDIPERETQTAAAAIRWTDEWDNLDGTIERGYAGPSIFFQGGHVRQDLHRAAEYARLLASVGINGCNINNVNADLDLLTTKHLVEFARIADAFRPWGVKLALSVDLTSPQTVGGLSTFDPLDPVVSDWWRQKADEIYRLIPDFGGLTVKADSEGRLGPAKYHRSPADAANVLARALAPHGGIVLYRGFVYNNHLDWRDPKADRARAGVDNFARYDSQFAPNVIIQIKEGPIDFQAREPVSPLFAALQHTNVAIEVQTAQEYTGQQRHMVWLPSMWKMVLDTDLRALGHRTPVKEIVEGRSFPLTNGKPRLGGFISVTNVGMEANWLHHPMAMANLYGFGKLAWNPDEPLNTIIDTWTRLTWGNDPAVDNAIDGLQLRSWKTYEGYTGPNGMGTLTNILGYHFGPGIESAERNGWGQWFRGDKDGIGMDRTETGSGYVRQYPPELSATYESLQSCPDDLLLFFHHVPYDYKLHSGKTLVQSIYDEHYRSAQVAGEYISQWKALKGRIDDERYQQVLRLFTYQAGHAIVWRDAINDWFFRISQIADTQGRVGHHVNRIEAENMTGTGYEPIAVNPWETASQGKAMICNVAAGCSLTTQLRQPSGRYKIAVQYFDIWRGASHFELLLNGRSIAQWTADDTLPPAQFDPNPDGQTSTRFMAHDVSIATGDTLELKAIPDLREGLDMTSNKTTLPEALSSKPDEHWDYRERAPVDYIELIRTGSASQEF